MLQAKPAGVTPEAWTVQLHLEDHGCDDGRGWPTCDVGRHLARIALLGPLRARFDEHDCHDRACRCRADSEPG